MEARLNRAEGNVQGLADLFEGEAVHKAEPSPPLRAATSSTSDLGSDGGGKRGTPRRVRVNGEKEEGRRNQGKAPAVRSLGVTLAASALQDGRFYRLIPLTSSDRLSKF